jgi:hypothetical protein
MEAGCALLKSGHKAIAIKPAPKRICLIQSSYHLVLSPKSSIVSRSATIGADKMLSSIDPGSQTEMTAHIIQIALTPVFLLSGIATLLGVFSNRLARVADRVDQLNQNNQLESHTSASELTRLHHRSVALDCAVVLGAMAAAATCSSALTLLLGTLKSATIDNFLFATFSAALLFSLGAIGCFTVEMLMTTVGVRNQLAPRRQ